MTSFISYTLGRLGLLVLALGLGYVAGLRGPLLIIMAFLGSGVMSFFMLGKQRTSLGVKIAGYFQGINARIDANTRKEDID